MTVKKGDMLWVEIKGAQQNYGFGEVVEAWEEEGIGWIFNFHCLVNEGLRMGYEKNIIEKPSARMHGKLAEAQKELNEILKKM